MRWAGYLFDTVDDPAVGELVPVLINDVENWNNEDDEEEEEED